MVPKERGGQSRETGEFEELVSPYLPALYRTARRFAGNADDAQDLIQEVLLKVYPRLAEFRVLEKPGPWLTRVLYRAFIDMQRGRNRRHRDIAVIGAACREDEEAAPAGVSLQPSGTNPDSLVLREELGRALARALEVLDESQRALVVLHDMEGYTVPEIAELLDKARGTVKSGLHRARERLRQCLDEEPFLDTERVIGREAEQS